MNILVYNLAAEYAGAMTVLENFYKQAVSCKDYRIKWYFLVSTNKLKSRDNVVVDVIPWVKKTWLHRYFYDNFLVQKYVKKHNIDLIYSMQNMPVKHVHVKQVVYLHQSLQFSPVKFSLFDKEQRGYAIRQKFICNIYKRNLKYADHIIVQTEWFKNAVKDWIPFAEEKISVVKPDVKIDPKYLSCQYELDEAVFFYPAGDGMHKNHKLIIEACKHLQEQGITNYKVVFTLDPETAQYSKRIKQETEERNLNIELVGILEKEKVFEFYSRSVLVFPSYLETFGLPLQEAAKMGAIVLASDMPFSHEALGDYKNAYYFGIDDAYTLAGLMKKIIKRELKYTEVKTSILEEVPLTELACLLDVSKGFADE